MKGAAAGPTLALPDVTLCCVDTRYPELAAFALAHCQAAASFADAVLFTDTARAGSLAGNPRIVPTQLASIEQYSSFMHRGLAAQVHTSHALVVQWDGLVRDAARWEAGFLGYDYIGAPWPGADPARAVGNGGFSLRSRRLLQALLDPDVRITHPEDVSICVVNRQLLEQRHGIRFAPLEVAIRFAYERTRAALPTFGFHGLHNMQRELGPAELLRFVHALPAALTRTKEAVDLCRAMIDQGQLDAASLLIDKRRQIGLLGSRTMRLAWRLRWARLRGVKPARP